MIIIVAVAQNKATKNNYIKTKIDNPSENIKWDLSGDKHWTVNHITECNRLAQKKYKNN